MDNRSLSHSLMNLNNLFLRHEDQISHNFRRDRSSGHRTRDEFALISLSNHCPLLQEVKMTRSKIKPLIHGYYFYLTEIRRKQYFDHLTIWRSNGSNGSNGNLDVCIWPFGPTHLKSVTKRLLNSAVGLTVTFHKNRTSRCKKCSLWIDIV